MNILYESLPDFVMIRGNRYRIITDFREWIKFLELAVDETVPIMKKAELMFQWYIDRPDRIDEDTLNALFAFAKAEELYPNMGRAAHEESGADMPAFSFSVDACCIYCAFQECYGLDLQRSQMHWWRFKVLFDGLPEDSEIKQRIRYRTMNVGKIKDKEERLRVKEIQRRIALPVSHAHMPDDFEIGDVF